MAPAQAATSHRKHRPSQPALSAPVALDTTSYCEGAVTASGVAPYVGEVASNLYPLGTHLVLSPPVFGISEFVVLDRIGYGSELDVYAPSCAAAIDFGRRTETVRRLQ